MDSTLNGLDMFRQLLALMGIDPPADPITPEQLAEEMEGYDEAEQIIYKHVRTVESRSSTVQSIEGLRDLGLTGHGRPYGADVLNELELILGTVMPKELELRKQGHSLMETEPNLNLNGRTLIMALSGQRTEVPFPGENEYPNRPEDSGIGAAVGHHHEILDARRALLNQQAEELLWQQQHGNKA